MEWGWRTVLILFGLLMVTAIVVDGIKRMRRARAEALRLDIDPGFISARDDVASAELPSKWRVVKPNNDTDPTFSGPLLFDDEPELFHPDRIPTPTELDSDLEQELETALEDELQAELDAEFKTEFAPQSPMDDPAYTASVSPTRTPIRPVNLDEQVPVLLDVEELGSENNDELPAFIATAQPVRSSFTAPVAPVAASVADAAVDMPTDCMIDDDYFSETTADVIDSEPALPNPVVQPVNFAHPDAEKLSARPAPAITLVIHCIAPKEQPFAGKDILYLFNSCDLRFGEKEIFHRFDQAEGKGSVQFSVVHSYEPQTFVPLNMATQEFAGLSFFMKLPGAKDSLSAFEAMVAVAKVLEKDFNADLYDNDRSALTQQTIEHDRQLIIDFERRQQVAAKKMMRG